MQHCSKVLRGCFVWCVVSCRECANATLLKAVRAAWYWILKEGMWRDGWMGEDGIEGEGRGGWDLGLGGDGVVVREGMVCGLVGGGVR